MLEEDAALWLYDQVERWFNYDCSAQEIINGLSDKKYVAMFKSQGVTQRQIAEMADYFAQYPRNWTRLEGLKMPESILIDYDGARVDVREPSEDEVRNAVRELDAWIKS